MISIKMIRKWRAGETLRKRLNSGHLLILLSASLILALLFRFSGRTDVTLVEMQRRYPVLGTFATYIVIAEEESAGRILSSMDSLARYLDNELGVQGSGELSALNMRGYAFIPELSSDMNILLEESFFISSVTDSLFDPAMGVLVKTWGFPLDPHLPCSTEINSALAMSGLGNIRICGDTLFLENGALLDFGAVAKGYTADRVYLHSLELGAAATLVEIGGEIRCGSDSNTDRVWRIAIRDPRSDEIYEILELENGAVATSGDYESYFFDNGLRLCHILDPRTGFPETGVASASVVCSEAVHADAIATALTVGGTDIAESLPDSLFRLIIVMTENASGDIEDWRRGTL